MIASMPKGIPGATLADLLAIPEDDRRCELIGGSIVDKGAATGEHGAAQHKLAASLDPYDQRPGGRRPGGWWLATSVDIQFVSANTFRPDMVGWRRARVPERLRGAPITLRPDWVCDILSTNKRNDLIKKKRVYHHHQVPHYWIIDPEQESLSVHRWAPDGYMEILVAERGEQVRAEPFDVMPLQVGVLFGDDEDGDEPTSGT